MSDKLIEYIRLAYNYVYSNSSEICEAIVDSDNSRLIMEMIKYYKGKEANLHFILKLKAEFFRTITEYLIQSNGDISELKDIDVNNVLKLVFDLIESMDISDKKKFSIKKQKQVIISLFTLINLRKEQLTNGKKVGKRDIFPIISELLEKTPGLAFGFQENNYTATSYNGQTNRFTKNSSKRVKKRTYFDIASITKLITVLTILDFAEKNNIPLDKKISEISSSFINNNILNSQNENTPINNISNFSLLELLSFYINPYTKDLKNVTSKDEALQSLRNYYISTDENNHNNPEKYKTHSYNDTSYMLLTDVIPTLPILRQEFLINNRLSNLIVLFSDLSNAMQITGGNEEQTRKRIPNDYKCEYLEDYCNHAGYFATLKGLLNLLKVASSKLSDLKLQNYPQIRNYASQIKRGLGVYIWKESGFDATEVPDFMPNSIGIEGYTGVWGMTGDEMQMAIATNPLSTDNGTKPKDYVWSLDSLKRAMLSTNIATSTLIESLKKLGIKVDGRTFNVTLPSKEGKCKRIIKKMK